MSYIIIIVLAILVVVLLFRLWVLNLSGKAMEIILKRNNIYPSKSEIEEAMKEAVFH